MAKTKLALWHLIVAVIAILIISGSGGNFLGAIGIGELQTNDYQLAAKQYQTIKCIAESPDSYYINPSENSISGDENSWGYTRIDSNCISKTIELVDATAQASGHMGILGFTSLKDASGSQKCWDWANLKDCSQATNLVYGDTYTFCTNSDVKWTIIGKRPYLSYQNPDAPGFLAIPGTQNCILQDWTHKVKTAFDAITVTEETSPPTASNNPRGSTTSLDPNQGFRVGYAYDTKANIAIYTYKGKLAYCDGSQVPPKVVAYENIFSNYVVPGDEILVSGDKTCCTSWMCQAYWNLGTDYFCNAEFKCEEGADTGVTCYTDSDCEPIHAKYFTQGNQDFLISGECIGATYSSSGQCDTTHSEIECRPDKTYGDKCCFYDSVKGTYYLDWCESPIRECPSGMCCTSNQVSYFARTCQEGIIKGVVQAGAIECCNAEDDGIGECKATCEPVLGTGLLDKLINMVRDGLGVPYETAKSLFYLILLGVGVLLLLILLPSKGGGLGQRGYFGPMMIMPPSNVSYSRPRWMG